MKKLTVFVIAIMFFFKYDLCAQDNCPQQNFYTTNFLSDGKDSTRLRFPLKFSITNDSIIVSYTKVNRQFLAFRVLSKACSWNKDFSEGKSEYKLMLYDVRGNKFPTLIMSSNKKEPVYIELLYENAEKRVFTQL